ncbi:hypothetical protein [Subtercola endophyticus]|uniref:hypothetical protein n=1 Tax=Subtercola endophyticus TaxID=2895559 RepID=UPI001E3A1D6E|nr:hypothetical protein [Subtercola endophyticus]UFS60805.1 hypothetical protein LQ955_08750 [Subtercola endophyticus]
MLQITLAANAARTFQFSSETGAVVCVPQAPGWPSAGAGHRVTGSFRHGILRIAYASFESAANAVRLVIVSTDTRTGLSAEPSLSSQLDPFIADALLDAADETVNPVGALRDLLEFRGETAALTGAW